MAARFLVAALLLAGPVSAQDRTRDDPRGLIPVARPGLTPRTPLCAPIPSRPLTLPDLVDLALCNNPATSVAWASVRLASANIGIARSASLPSVDLAVGPTLSRSDSFNNRAFVAPDGSLISTGGGSTDLDTSARVALSYLLFDFGGRRARIQGAEADQRVALAQFADTAQDIAVNTIVAFNALEANRASVVAAEATIRFARSSLDLAAARKRAGVGLEADRLQAETALAQADLALVQARGGVQTSEGQLAVVVGLPPTTDLALAPAAPLASADLLKRGVDSVIADAERLRPDIRAARASVAGAEADVRAARSDARPQVSLSASNNLAAADTSFDRNSASIGVSVSVPLFSGYETRYRIAAARAGLERETASAEQTRQQAGLDVYTRYVELDTRLRSLTAARALIRSAQASANIAQGRYRAGVGIFTELLNAQRDLADARRQLVQSEFDVRSTQAELARAVGGIGEAVDELR